MIKDISLRTYMILKKNLEFIQDPKKRPPFIKKNGAYSVGQPHPYYEAIEIKLCDVGIMREHEKKHEIVFFPDGTSRVIWDQKRKDTICLKDLIDVSEAWCAHFETTYLQTKENTNEKVN